MNPWKFSAYVAPLTAIALTLSACGKSHSNSDATPRPPANKGVSLYDKYGGEPTIQKVVDDAVSGVLADPEVAPFFSVIGKPGHDSVDRLKSCLDLQFTALFGGPAQYPSVSHYRQAPPQGYACEDMKTAHEGLGISSAAFDKFIIDLASVLKADGVSDGDIAAVAPILIGLKPNIVE